MSYLTKNLPQSVTHWAKSGARDNYGNPTWDGPVVLNGRWEMKVEKILNTLGEEIIVQSTVFLDTDIAVGDYLMLGEFSSGEVNPLLLPTAYEVKAFFKTPNLRGTEFERVAKL